MGKRYLDVSQRHDPNDPRTAASPFAPDQPARGVVADDVPAEQNPAGGPKASEVDNSERLEAAEDESDEDDEPAPEPVAAPEPEDVDRYHVGGGWYEIDGEKVQGKDEARRLL